MLTASIVGIAEKEGIIDGSKIEENDAVIAVTSNGLHTNGYSLVRLLMDKMPQIKLDKVEGETFIIVTSSMNKNIVMDHINKFYDCYEIRSIVKCDNKIDFYNQLNWK